MDFVVTMRTKGGNTEEFVVSAQDEPAARELLDGHQAAGDRRHYWDVSGVRVDVVWRNISFPDYTLTPVPCS